MFAKSIALLFAAATLRTADAGVCAGGTNYTVVAGDTCAAIAQKEKTDVEHVTTTYGSGCPSTMYLGMADLTLHLHLTLILSLKPNHNRNRNRNLNRNRNPDP
jgi:hypothetical protein